LSFTTRTALLELESSSRLRETGSEGLTTRPTAFGLHLRRI